MEGGNFIPEGTYSPDEIDSLYSLYKLEREIMIATRDGLIDQPSAEDLRNAIGDAKILLLTSGGRSLPSTETFTDRFTRITGGLTPQEAISLYGRRTGIILRMDTLEKLFTNPVQSGKILSLNPILNKILRDILNLNVPSTEAQMSSLVNSGDWVQMPTLKNLLHGGPVTTKYVSADGHREALYYPNGRLVQMRSIKGTFNFFSPNTNAIGHIYADILPWSIWGN